MKDKIKHCFSYIRFSSSKQQGNSSVDRQSPIAARVANEQGWKYMEQWNAKDLGVSAFRGDNVATIRSIIDSVKQGKIPKGSVLILEALDRATRLNLDDAQQLIRDILKCGLEIYTDMNKRHLTAESLNKVTDVMLTAVELDAAYQYSNRQRERSTKGLEKNIKAIAKGEKVYMGGQMPSYIEGIENGEFIINQDKVKVIRHIFKEYLKGTTLYQIAIQLNEGVKQGKFIEGLKRKKSGKWDRQTIKHILNNVAYTGDFKLMGVKYENYLPVKFVTTEQFKLIQDQLEVNTKRRGSVSGNINSIFNGTAKCSHCGSPMTAIISKDGNNRFNYYGCSSARYKKCSAKGWLKTHVCELDFCMLFLQKNPLDLVGTNDEANINRITQLKAELQRIDESINSTIDAIGIGVGVNRLKEKLEVFKVQQSKVEAELEEVSKLIQTNAAIPESISSIKKMLGDIFTGTDEQVDKATIEFRDASERVYQIIMNQKNRKQLKECIHQLVKRVEFDVVKGGFTVIKHSGEASKFFQVAF